MGFHEHLLQRRGQTTFRPTNSAILKEEKQYKTLSSGVHLNESLNLQSANQRSIIEAAYLYRDHVLRIGIASKIAPEHF